ncbi:putative signal transduction protein [Escherichia coli]|uniref:Putative signal transduction protein n=1 Tax=Escherichia coli TaxID=562 RepID=A0A447XET4_ECOLX|nr:putative signal transduction protein [Escherichia coli]
MINIDLLTAMLLEPQLPQISSASLTVDKTGICSMVMGW